VIPANRQRNYLQSALYVIITGVLAAMLLERLLTYAEAAERAAMEATLSQLQSGLYARMAYLTLRGEYQTIDALPSRSPFLVAKMRSSNYLGEFDGVPSDARGGYWMFDRVSSELVYVPNLKRYLTEGSSNQAATVLRFRLEILKGSRYGYTGVSLRPVGTYVWTPLP
jgi:hypothetical protein